MSPIPTPSEELVRQFRAALEPELAAFEAPQWAYCTDHTLRRYLIARRSNVDKSLKMLLATLKWRKDMDVENISAASIKPNGMLGKVMTRGVDRCGRPCFFMRPGFERTKDDHEGNIRHLVYQLERARSCLDEDAGVGKFLVLLDFHNMTRANQVPMRTSREVLNILQNHYPERLGKFLILDAPWYFNAFFSVIKPFIDPLTRDKIVFLSGDKAQQREKIAEVVNLAMVPRSMQGDADDESFFDPDVYFSFEDEERCRVLARTLRSKLGLE